MPHQIHILIIDDDPAFTSSLMRLLRIKSPYLVDTQNDPQQALVDVEKKAYDCIICDYNMPRLNGHEVLKKIKQSSPNTPVIILTGTDKLSAAIDCLKSGATDFISKPIKTPELIKAIEEAIGKQQLSKTGINTDLIPGIQDLSPLKEGGMGFTFTCLYQGQKAVLKALKNWDLSQLSSYDQERFQREIFSLHQLEHQNIIKILQSGTIKNTGAPYLIMEYFEGQELKDFLSAQALPLAQAIPIILQICAGIQEIHRHQMIYRDLSPRNILINNEQLIKIIDFGLIHTQESTLTQTNMLMGTPGYISPEVILGHEITCASDLFNIGIITYEILTGKNPFFNDSNIRKSYLNIIKGEYPAITDSLPDLPQAIIDFITSCLAPKVENRFKDIEAASTYLCQYSNTTK